MRRAALGVIRICLENNLRLGLTTPIKKVLKYLEQQGVSNVSVNNKKVRDVSQEVLNDLLYFFCERLKVYLRGHGMRPDLIDAVFSIGGDVDIALTVKRVVALRKFLATDDGVNLLSGIKRAINILTIEEKKDGISFNVTPDRSLFQDIAESTLSQIAADVKQRVFIAIKVEDFEAAMQILASLRAPVDHFFKHVKVNEDTQAVRANRLKILSEIRNSTEQIADFSKITSYAK